MTFHFLSCLDFALISTASTILHSLPLSCSATFVNNRWRRFHFSSSAKGSAFGSKILKKKFSEYTHYVNKIIQLTWNKTSEISLKRCHNNLFWLVCQDRCWYVARFRLKLSLNMCTCVWVTFSNLQFGQGSSLIGLLFAVFNCHRMLYMHKSPPSILSLFQKVRYPIPYTWTRGKQEGGVTVLG